MDFTFFSSRKIFCRKEQHLNDLLLTGEYRGFSDIPLRIYILGMNYDIQEPRKIVLAEGFFLMGGGRLEGVSRRDVRDE